MMAEAKVRRVVRFECGPLVGAWMFDTYGVNYVVEISDGNGGQIRAELYQLEALVESLRAEAEGGGEVDCLVEKAQAKT